MHRKVRLNHSCMLFSYWVQSTPDQCTPLGSKMGEIRWTAKLSGIFSVNPPPPIQLSPVKRSSEIIIEVTVTTNQIAVFHNSNCIWNSSLIVVGNWNFCTYCGGNNRKDPAVFQIFKKSKLISCSQRSGWRRFALFTAWICHDASEVA